MFFFLLDPQWNQGLKLSAAVKWATTHNWGPSSWPVSTRTPPFAPRSRYNHRILKYQRRFNSPFFFWRKIYSFTKTTALNGGILEQHVRHIKTLKSSQITRERDLCYHRRCVWWRQSIKRWKADIIEDPSVYIWSLLRLPVCNWIVVLYLNGCETGEENKKWSGHFLFGWRWKPLLGMKCDAFRAIYSFKAQQHSQKKTKVKKVTFLCVCSRLCARHQSRRNSKRQFHFLFFFYLLHFSLLFLFVVIIRCWVEIKKTGII
jgi:hypothetical protein